MTKALWLLTKPVLALLACLTGCYAVLVLLCVLTEGNTFFFVYVQGFFLVFDIIVAACAAQTTGGYLGLALSLGATRRSLRGAVAAFWVLMPLLCMVLDHLCNSVTAWLFLPQMNSFFLGLLHYPVHGLGFKLLLCGAMLWLGTLEFGALARWKQVLIVLLMIFFYLQITVFMFLTTLFPTLILTVYSLLLGAVGVLFAGLTLHRVGQLAITQV